MTAYDDQTSTIATFSLSCRELPLGMGFVVSAGIDRALDFLGELGFTGDVWAVPEGRILFRREPVMELTAPLSEAGTAAIALTNLVGAATARASGLARYRIAAGGYKLIVDGERADPEDAIRIGGKDCLAEARRARHLLDEDHRYDAQIIAGPGLDEFDIEQLVAMGAPIDAYDICEAVGAGTKLPPLDAVCSLVSAGRQLFRRPGLCDTVGLRDEAPLPGSEALLVPVMQVGRRIVPRSTPEAVRDRFLQDLDELPPRPRGLQVSQGLPVGTTRRLRSMLDPRQPPRPIAVPPMTGACSLAGSPPGPYDDSREDIHLPEPTGRAAER